jgi:hypothetical protein
MRRLQAVVVCLCLVSLISPGVARTEDAEALETDSREIAPPNTTVAEGEAVSDVEHVDAVSVASEYVGAPLPMPPNPWKTLFYDNDFGYRSLTSDSYYFGDTLKERRLSVIDGLDLFDESCVSVGGELRYRFMNEANRLRPGGPGRSTYELWRWRNYVDVKASDEVRVYVEMLDASIFNQELPVTPIDLNRWNIQNAFVDIKLAERDGRPVIFRAGRQELLYGAQHLISPLDWGNT